MDACPDVQVSEREAKVVLNRNKVNWFAFNWQSKQGR